MSRIAWGLCVLLLAFHGNASAVTASIFTITEPNAPTINPQEDHFSVVLEASWISRQEGFLQNLLSRAKGGLVEINGTVTFDDNQTAQVVNAITLDDPKNSMGRALGFKGPVYADLPADISQLEVAFKIALTEEDRLASLLGSLDSNKAALPAEVLTSPWIGYGKLVSVVTETLFGTKDTDYPLSARYRVSMPMKEHYVVIVASTDDNDSKLAGASAEDFTFAGQRLRFAKGPVPKEWTYFVLKVKVNPERKSVVKRAIGADTPWATVIRTQLRVLPVSKARDASQLSAVADTALTALENLEKFLGSDRSFSNFDRAGGLFAYSDNAVKVISGECKSKGIGDCPVGELSQYRNQIGEAYHFPATKVAIAGTAIQLQVKVEDAIMAGKIKNPKGTRQVPLLGLASWEKYVASRPGVASYDWSLQDIFSDAVSKVQPHDTVGFAWDPIIQQMKACIGCI